MNRVGAVMMDRLAWPAGAHGQRPWPFSPSSPHRLGSSAAPSPTVFTMPPLYQESFTSALRERLHLDRSRIQEWAEHEKEHIDVLAERYRAQAMEQQSALDSAMTHYVTLKMQADCQVQEAVQAQGTVEELQEQAMAREQEIDSLQRQLDEKKAAIRGKYMKHIRKE